MPQPDREMVPLLVEVIILFPVFGLPLPMKQSHMNQTNSQHILISLPCSPVAYKLIGVGENMAHRIKTGLNFCVIVSSSLPAVSQNSELGSSTYNYIAPEQRQDMLPEKNAQTVDR